MSTRILLADDHQMILGGLRSLLRDLPGMEVIAEATDGHTAVRLAAELSPDVVIMDINMPDLNGIEATRQMRGNNGGGPKVIALSAHSDERYARAMLRAGASGYVLKHAAFEELATALKLVVANQTYLSPSIAQVIVKDYVRDGTAFSTLTAREREVLQLLAEGKATKQAAMHLKLSVKTIETHRNNIKNKLGIESTAELTKYAIREGLTTLDAGSPPSH
jgi:two-component system, NarL family, response regulator NreC